MASELLEHYTAEQLRCHWLSLGLDQKAVSFAPKAFDTSVSHKDKKTGEEILVCNDPRVADPALKESAFLTNIFNRLARSCFRWRGQCLRLSFFLKLPHMKMLLKPHARQRSILTSAQHIRLMLTVLLLLSSRSCRTANKRWDDASKASKGDNAAYEHALADAFVALRTTALLMHPAAPSGCEKICTYLGFEPDLFFSWSHAFDTPVELAQLLGQSPAEHQITQLPPRFDFFKGHPSQNRKGK